MEIKWSNERQDRYDSILSLLIQAELAARNGQWPTCGTYARQVAEKCFGVKLQVESDER